MTILDLFSLQKTENSFQHLSTHPACSLTKNKYSIPAFDHLIVVIIPIVFLRFVFSKITINSFWNFIIYYYSKTFFVWGKTTTGRSNSGYKNFFYNIHKGKEREIEREKIVRESSKESGKYFFIEKMQYGHFSHESFSIQFNLIYVSYPEFR